MRSTIFKQLFDATSDAQSVHDADGRIVIVNESACTMFGCTREEALRLSIADFSSNEDPYTQAHAEQLLGRALTEGQCSFEWRCRRRDGSLFWAEIALHRFELGGCPHVMASMRDIDTRKRMEEALRASEQRFETIFNATSTMLAFTERSHGRIVDVNLAWLRTTGLRREQAIGKTGSELGLWANIEDRARVLDELDVRGCVPKIEVELVMGGRRMPTQLSVQHVERNGERYILWEIVDLSERKRAEAEQEELRSQLLQAQKMESIGRLAGGIAHDFNNMLSAILGFGDLALMRLPTESPEHGFVGEMIRAGERASELIKQLLAFSRKQVMQPRTIDPNDVVRELEPMLRRLIDESVILQLSLTQTRAIRVDAAQLEQVILNLIVNARDAMPEGGTLTIETLDVEFDDAYVATHAEARVGPHVMIAVSDTGVGMDALTRARAFDPFFTTKGPGEGTGLGLAMVYGIVKQSGGWVWLYSEPGRGTTVKLCFPPANGSVMQPATSEPPPVAQRSDTVVLLVEDDPQVRLLMATILDEAGYTVLVAEGPLEAIGMAERSGERIDVLLSDVVMPTMNGRQLAERIIASRPSMQVVFVSGYTENTIAHRGELDESVNFLSKPITANRLLGLLERVLARGPE